MADIRDFIKVSHYSGMREDLIQAGGGNTSLKLENGEMRIKASGVQLTDITTEEGYATVNSDMIVTYLEALLMNQEPCDEKEILKQALIAGKRPSIETFLHACTDILTLHTHSVVVNILAARRDGMEILKSLFPDALMVGYATPGLALAREFYGAYKNGIRAEGRTYQLIFLKNHGLIVTGKNADEVIRLTEYVTNKIEAYLGMDFSYYHDITKLYELWCSYSSDFNEIIYKVETKSTLDFFEKNGKKIWEYQFCPDCMVFCGKNVLHFQNEPTISDISVFTEKNGNPVIMIYKDHLFLKTDSVKKAKEIESVLAFSARVAEANQGYEMDILSEQEQKFLLNWDAEKYRQQMK